MILLDTHAAIWFATNRDELGPQSRKLVSAALVDEQLSISAVSFWEIALLIGAVLLPEVCLRYGGVNLRERVLRAPLIVRWLSYEAAFLLVVLFGQYGARQFIYFQF